MGTPAATIREAAVWRLCRRARHVRHLAAINLVRADVGLPTVQAHLGHRHLISTLRYAACADETASARAARALNKIHGKPDEEEDAAGSSRHDEGIDAT